MNFAHFNSLFGSIDLTSGLALTCGGLVVGFIVGLTGVGGGSLMTPLLILLFGVKPHLAIGTDLLFAAFTKSGALPNLIRQRRVDWLIVGLLSIGSISASLATTKAMQSLGPQSDAWQSLTCHLLGAMLLLTALSMFYKVWKTQSHPKHFVQNLQQLPGHPTRDVENRRPGLSPRQVVACIVLGVVLGALVTLTSVGAGAIGTAVLIALFPAMPLPRIVANDIAHAIPLTFIAGLGHAWVGTVDWTMLAWLLVGSLPGIWLGTHSFQRFSEPWVRGGLSILLAYAGLRLALS